MFYLIVLLSPTNAQAYITIFSLDIILTPTWFDNFVSCLCGYIYNLQYIYEN